MHRAEKDNKDKNNWVLKYTEPAVPEVRVPLCQSSFSSLGCITE